MVAIDLSKAFDCICHNLLLAKLKAYRLHDTALKLLRSFLHERKQRVMCNNSCSNWTPIRSGVPQGSLLSPLLFDIFMNDTKEAVIDFSLGLYADDTTQYVADKNPTVLQSSLNQEMERLSSWLDHNYPRANGDKTQAMVLGKSTHHYDLKFNGAPIDIKEHLKILGVIIINTLEHRRIEQSVTIFYKCYKENGPSYLADLFEPRITPYNLRNTANSVTIRIQLSSLVSGTKYHFLLKVLLTYCLLEEN